MTEKPITDEIASIEKDIFRDYLGKIQLNPDKVLKSESGGKGIELYEDLLRDDKVGSALQTRRLAVIGKEWEIVPASEKRQDVKIADYVKEVLLGFNYDAARKALLSGVVLGFKPAEVMWEYSEGDIWIADIKGRASRRFVFGLKEELRLLTPANMIEGEELPDKKFIVYKNTSDNGSPYGDGLGRLLYWPCWFKKNAIKFWMIFADKFGSPTAIGKYPAGTQKEQQDALLAALEAIQQESAIKIPDNMIIELLEAARTGSIDTYEKLCNFMNSAIAQIMLGQTLTSDIGDKGSYAASQTHEDVRQDYLKADADGLCECQNNSLIRWIVDYNFPNAAYPKVWIRTEQEKDLKPLAERDQILVQNIGLPVSQKYFYETYGIPEPQEGEELISPAAKPLFSPAGFNEKNKDTALYNSACSCGKEHNFAAAQDEWISQYLERIAPSMQNVRESALRDIEKWLRTLDAPPSEDVFISKTHDILGSAFEQIDKKAIADAVGEIYAFHKLTDRIMPEIDAVFGGADIRAIDFLSQLDNFYLSKFIKNPDVISQLNDFLKTKYSEQGIGLFGRGAEGIQEFKNLLSQKMIDLSEWQIQRIIDTSVQRARNWAHISQINDGGIAEIEIYEPTKDCPFCKAIDGMVIQVNTAYQKMMSQAEMSPSEYELELKNNQPNLESLADFVDQGLLPPYHPHCHGRIIKRIRR